MEETSLEGNTCDVVINVNVDEFNVHKIILCGCSTYFQALFSNRWHSVDKRVYTISGISPETMKLILEYAYTGLVSVTVDNVESLLVAADQFNVLGVIKFCCDFLESQLCPENSIGIWKLVDFCPELRQSAYSFILQNFEEIARASEEFLELTLPELCNFIEKDELNVKQEDVVFDAILRWIAHAPVSRKPHISVLLAKVRMAVMNEDYFRNIVMNNEMVKNSEECWAIIKNTLMAMQNLKSNGLSCSRYKNLLVRPRLPSAILLAIGGWNRSTSTSGIEAYDTRANCWVSVTLEEERWLAYQKTVYLNGFVYCIGGYNSKHTYVSACKFDPITRTWHQVAPMYSNRCYASVVLLNGFIYAMGGCNGIKWLKTAERYDPETNQWTIISSMNEQRSNASATTLHGKIYICGGRNINGSLLTAECYDPLTDQWTPIAMMHVCRTELGVIAYNEKVYAVGGFSGSTWLWSVEAYNPLTDSWNFMPPMSKLRTKFGIEVIDDRLFVVGGYTEDPNRSVEFYDKNDNRWHDARDMTVPRCNVSCCVVPALPSITQYAAPREPPMATQNKIKLSSSNSLSSNFSISPPH